MNLDLRCDTRICRSKSELLCNHTNGIQDIKFPCMREFARLIFSSTTQLNNNGILIGIVSVPPNPQSTRGLRSRHHHSPLAICMEKAATVSFPLAFFFSPLFPIILTAALSIKLLFRQWHSSPSLSWRGELDPSAAIPCSSVAWRRWRRWVCLSFLFPPHHSNFFLTATFSN